MPAFTRGAAAATFLLLALAPLGVASTAGPPLPAPKTAAVAHTGEAVRIDGRLSEEVWATVPIVTDLVQRDPDEGKPATERTEIRVAYDDNALYIGARLFDSQADRIVRRRSRRDSAASSDLLRVYLDPHHDHKTGVMLTVSAAGSLADAWLSNDFESDASWDGVWDAAVTVDEGGWTVEMRVPFSQLRFSPGDRQTWGLNVSRFIQRANEEDWWVLVPKTDSRLVSGFGHLDGLDGIRPKNHLELLPYATVGLERAGTVAVGDPFSRPNRPAGGAGLDLKWGMTSSFTMDGTINPDFGQVELDPAVVNLTAFETFYQEKRPFFIEGSQQFNTFGRNGLPLYGRFGSTYPSLWYSRRIGRSPRLTASGEYIDQPASTTILGAAKVTGRTAGGWNMSVVDAVTARETAQVAVGDTQSTMEVEPLSNYAALRASRDVAGRGAFGLIATGVNRSLQSEALQRTTPGGAYTGGVDGNWFLDSRKNWVVSGLVGRQPRAGRRGGDGLAAAIVGSVLPAAGRVASPVRPHGDVALGLDRPGEREPHEGQAARGCGTVGDQSRLRVERRGLFARGRPRGRAHGLDLAEDDARPMDAGPLGDTRHLLALEHGRGRGRSRLHGAGRLRR